MQVAKWGNSLAIRLPSQLVKALKLKPGDDVSVTVKGDRTIELAREQAQEEKLAEAWAALQAMARPLPEGWKFDREEIYEELLRDGRPTDV